MSETLTRRELLNRLVIGNPVEPVPTCASDEQTGCIGPNGHRLRETSPGAREEIQKSIEGDDTVGPVTPTPRPTPTLEARATSGAGCLSPLVVFGGGIAGLLKWTIDRRNKGLARQTK